MLIESGMIEHCYFLLEDASQQAREFILSMLMNLTHFHNGREVYKQEEN